MCKRIWDSAEGPQSEEAVPIPDPEITSLSDWVKGDPPGFWSEEKKAAHKLFELDGWPVKVWVIELRSGEFVATAEFTPGRSGFVATISTNSKCAARDVLLLLAKKEAAWE